MKKYVFPSSRDLPRWVPLLLLTLLVLPSATPSAWAAAGDSVVIQWDSAGLQAIRESRPAPPVVARAMAILHTCIFDAWAAYDPVAGGTRLGGALRRPPEERTRANKRRRSASPPPVLLRTSFLSPPKLPNSKP